MNPFLLTAALIILLCSGCVTSTVERLSADEKRGVQIFLTPTFKFPEAREEETYRLVYAARRMLTEATLIRAVEFKDATHATIYIKAAPGNMHGGPSIDAVREEGEWKFGHWWFPL